MTVQEIISAAQQDAMNLIGANHPALIDYCNRVSLSILRASRWDFLVSDVKRFVTQRGVTDYWIGATGSNVEGQFDTGLNLTDVKYIKQGSVFDRSNFKILGEVTESPLTAKLAFADAAARPGRPAVYRNSFTSPNVLNVYPAADNQNNYQPVPESPICTTTAGGALAARVYYVTVTYVDSQGNESSAPTSTKLYVPANKLLVVHPPQEPVSGTTGIAYDRYKVYASAILGAECVQNGGTAISTGSTFTESVGGLSTGTSTPPTTNSVEPIDGYVIEFRYYKTAVTLTATNQTLQIPDQYKDVVVSGVNWLVNKYLSGRENEAQVWFQMWQKGISELVRDRNWASRYSDYLYPDASAVRTGIDTLDNNVIG